MKIAFLFLSALTFTGCAGFKEKYNAQRWTPDGVNYTYATDSKLKPEGHWFGVSWSLKD